MISNRREGKGRSELLVVRTVSVEDVPRLVGFVFAAVLVHDPVAAHVGRRRDHHDRHLLRRCFGRRLHIGGVGICPHFLVITLITLLFDAGGGLGVVRRGGVDRLGLGLRGRVGREVDVAQHVFARQEDGVRTVRRGVEARWAAREPTFL